MEEKFEIRKAKREDIKLIFGFIKELAEWEKTSKNLTDL